MTTPVPGPAPGLTNAVPLMQLTNGTTALPNMKIVAGTVTTTNGVATVYSTVDGTSTGAPAISQILHADCVAWTNTSTLTQMPLISGKAISSDLRSVTFNVVIGTSIVVGGSVLAAAPNGTTVSYLVLGVP